MDLTIASKIGKQLEISWPPLSDNTIYCLPVYHIVQLRYFLVETIKSEIEVHFHDIRSFKQHYLLLVTTFYWILKYKVAMEVGEFAFAKMRSFPRFHSLDRLTTNLEVVLNTFESIAAHLMIRLMELPMFQVTIRTELLL